MNNDLNDKQKSILKIVPKKFVSLSDILNRPVPTLPTSQTTSVLSPLIEIKNEIINDKLSKTGASAKDLLTVQELFKELELDCDEQIKRLDEKERTQKEINIKQTRILNEIKQKWFLTKQGDVFKSTTPTNNRKLKCNCFSKQSKLNTNKHLNKLKFSKINKFKNKNKFQFIIQLSNNKNNKQQALFKLNLSSNRVKQRLVYSSNKTNKNCLHKIENLLSLELFTLKSWKEIFEKNSKLEFKNCNIKQPQSLLDKYYEKYCNQSKKSLNQLLLSDTSSEYLSSSSAPLSSSSTSSSMFSTGRQLDTKKVNITSII